MNGQVSEKSFPAPGPLWLVGGLLLLQVALFYPTYWSMVQIWWRSETFAHGFLIFPIAGYLIWRKRKALTQAELTTDVRALLPLAGLGVIWLVAQTVDVNAVKQFAAVLMIPALVWLCLGWRIVSILAFPLGFLLFAVPFGEFLVYPLMKYTAAFTVSAVRLVGIPVYWEGMYFSLPSGSWSVVEACSGFRYILASLTLGALYAYLSYQSFWRRAAFMLLALLIPILANGLRAFMIVMIGHFSGMELAVGVDHLIYGWVWFGIVMFFMFWIGSFWQEKITAPEIPSWNSKKGLPLRTYRPVRVLLPAIVFLALPVALAFNGSPGSAGEAQIRLPDEVGAWQKIASPLSDWQPQFQGASQEFKATYKLADRKIGLHVAYFSSQRQGAELVNQRHRLVPLKQQRWKELYREKRAESVAGHTIGLVQAQIKTAEQTLQVWQWKYFNGVRTSNDFYLKALEAWAKVSGKPRHGAAITVFTGSGEMTPSQLAQTKRQLEDFISALLPVLEPQLQVQIKDE